jgi:hypothetical protein
MPVTRISKGEQRIPLHAFHDQSMKDGAGAVEVLVGFIDNRCKRPLYRPRVRIGKHLEHVAVVVLVPAPTTVKREIVLETQFTRFEGIPHPGGDHIGIPRRHR